MSRSSSYLLEILEELNEKQVELKSLRENTDTSSTAGRAFLSIMGPSSQMDLEIKAECAEASRAAAKARGKSGGRPKTYADKLEKARILYQSSDKSAKQICELFGFSRRTPFSYMHKVIVTLTTGQLAVPCTHRKKYNEIERYFTELGNKEHNILLALLHTIPYSGRIHSTLILQQKTWITYVKTECNLVGAVHGGTDIWQSARMSMCGAIQAEERFKTVRASADCTKIV